MADSMQLIRDKLEENAPLFRRMDKDRDLYNQIEYKLLGADRKPLKDVVNITMNDAKVFAERSQSFMSEASMQTVVEGRNIRDADTTLIENFDEDIRYELDRALLPRELQGLYNFLIEQVCIRGRIGARFTAWDNKGKFMPDILPCDSRYLLYEYGDRELEWAAYPSVQTRSYIEQKYPQAKFNDKKGKLWNYSDREKNQVWLGSMNDRANASAPGLLLKEEPNIFGYVPYAIEGVGAGSMLQDEGAIEHYHESIFSGTRLLYEHINMLASILQTLNYWTFAGPYGWESEAGIEGVVPKEWRGTQTTTPVDKGTRGLFPFQISDVNNATRIFYALLTGAIQRGSLPNIDYGNLTFPLSAVAISRLTATKDAIFLPRLQAIAYFYRKLHYIIKDQYIRGGYEADLGAEGMERHYTASDLDKKYTINYKFYAVSPEQDIANYSVAQQAMAIGMSKHTVFTDILKLKNPEGEIMKAQAEQASQIDPVLALYDYGHALINKQAYFKARLIMDKIKQLIRERYMPPEQKPKPAEVPSGRTASPQGMIPLLEGPKSGSGPARSEFEEASPEEMVANAERRGETVRKQSQES